MTKQRRAAKAKPLLMWAVVDSIGNIMWDCIRATRSSLIIGLRLFGGWKYMQRKGYRIVRVRIEVVKP